MIDKTQPPPGWRRAGVDREYVTRETTLANPRHSSDLRTAWGMYEEESRPAVIDFAERVAAWLCDPREYSGHTLKANMAAARLLLAAARGDRTL